MTAAAEANCAGDAGENNDCGSGPSFTVTDLNGTQYFFPQGQSGADGNVLNDVNNSVVYPISIKDRNGNIIRFTPNPDGTGGGLPITDTLGREVISASTPVGPAIGVFPEDAPNIEGQPKPPLTYRVGGLPYTLTYTTTTASYQASFQKITNIPGMGCDATFTSNLSIPVVQSLSVPNGTSYYFKYDPTYGLVSEVDYPTGGWVKYQWKLSDTLSEASNFSGLGEPSSSRPVPYPGACLYEYQTPVIAQRTIGYSPGSAAAQTQIFTYNTAWNSTGQWISKTTTVTTVDNVTGKQSRTVYTYGAVQRPTQVNEGGQLPVQLPVETSVQYFDLSSSSGSATPLESVTKTWGDQFQMTSQTTRLQGGMAKTDVYCYDNTDLVQEKDEYGFGVAGPNLSQPPGFAYIAYIPLRPTCGSPTPTRKTLYGYSFSTAPCVVAVYDGSGNRTAETDAYLDGGSAPCLSGGAPTQGVNGLVAGTHDETNYGPSVTAQRGNPTKIVRWSSIGASATTTATYDETGQITSSTDACGNASCGDMTGTSHTTTYSYADNFTDAGAAGATNAYLTSITPPSPNGVALTTKYSYRYSDGQVASTTDPNNQTTNYSYSDRLNRLTLVQGPPDSSNGGQRPTSSYTYNDSSPSPTVTTSELLDASGRAKTSVSIMDGMGHVVQSELTSDPSGTDAVDTVYNGMGGVYSVSNPHRPGPSPTDGTTTFTYDALGRKVMENNPDGSSEQWCYNGVASQGQSNCSSNASSATTASWTDSTDEAGLHKQAVSDSFGRLAALIEPNPATGALGLETDYSYDTLNNLMGTIQHGASGESPRSRSFIYDSLSRLTSSTNPETGTIGYTYDSNSNLQTKTDARQILTTYRYDALNRLLSKAYSDGTPMALYGYDGNNESGTPLSSQTMPWADCR